MRGSRVLSLNGVKAVNFLKENGSLIFLTLIFVLGVLSGALFFEKQVSVADYAKNQFTDFLVLRQKGTFFAIFFSSLINLLIYFGGVFIAGTSVVGNIVSPFVVMWFGFNFGTLATYLYSGYALKGIAFSAIILIPSSAIFALILVFCSREAMRFSLLLTRLFTPQGVSASVYENFKSYCMKFLYYLAFVVLSATADALLSTFFIKFFDF